jgi:hypothetical protein
LHHKKVAVDDKTISTILDLFDKLRFLDYFEFANLKVKIRFLVTLDEK